MSDPIIAASPSILVPNRMFLQAAVGEEWNRVRVAIFAGDPKGQDPGVWLGGSAASMLKAPHAHMNTYYSVSLQSVGARRGIGSFERLFAIVVDDVGVKVDLKAATDILGAPSYILETSPGNCQAGWFCDLTDRDYAMGVVQAIHTALGAGDNLKNLVGYMRLPVGTNGKAAYSPEGFRHRLCHWAPLRRLSGLDWAAIEQRLGGVKPLHRSLDDPDSQPEPSPEAMDADPLLQALLELGLVQSPRSGSEILRPSTMGWAVDIDCPWIETHTDRPHEGAAYAPVIQRFRCHHGHCQDYGLAEFRGRLDELLAAASLPSLAVRDFAAVSGESPVAADPENISSAATPGEEDLSKSTMAPELGSYPAHELGIIDAFQDRQRDAFRYDWRRGRWMRWAGNRWQIDEAAFVPHAIEGVTRAFLKAHIDLKPGRVNVLARPSTLANLERGARSRRAFAVDGAGWDADPYLAGVPSGEINLRTGRISPGNPDHMISRQLTVDPNPRMSTPLWDQFLSESTGADHELISFLQAWCGYNLTGDTREEVFVFFWGPGGNGKGTFTGVLSAIMGRYATQAPAEMFMRRRFEAHPEEVARLSEVRAVFVSELPGGQTFNTTRLKDFTGRDTLTGRYMRENTFEFLPKFKLSLVGNDQPRLPETGEAIARRLILAPFTRTPAMVDPDLKAKLVPEYPGILSWMMRGERARQQAGGLKPLIPTAVTNATREYLDSQDTVKLWAEERCILDPKGVLTAAEAYDDYISWCSQHEILNRFHSEKTFGARLLERFQNTYFRRNDLRAYGGVRLKKDFC